MEQISESSSNARWAAIRTCCAVLLLVPLVHLAYLVASDTMASLDGAPDAWADELDAYVTADDLRQLPSEPILVIGGRRVKLWSGLEDILSPRPVLMRGLGNATVNDIIYNYERLVGYYQPDAVVLLPSYTEFHVREYKSAEEMAAAVKELVALDLSHGVTRKFFIFPPLKTPLHPEDDDKIDQTEALLRAWAGLDERVVVLDGNSVITAANGKARADFFRADGVNLNDTGYLRLSMLLWEQLKKG